MKLKAYDRHLKNAKNSRHVWTENEILSLRMQIHKQKHADDALRLIMTVNNGNYRITPEQSLFGIDFLRRKLFNLKGVKRSSAFARCFGDFEVNVLRKFKRFTFEGVRYDQNPYSGTFQTSPIYRCHAKDGSYFDYTMTHWGLPEVLNIGGAK